MRKTSKEEADEIRVKILEIRDHFGMTRKKMCQLLGNMNINLYASKCQVNQNRNYFTKTNLLVLKANVKKMQEDYKQFKH